MKFIQTRFSGAWLIEPRVFRDKRGFFMETYSKRLFADHGITEEFVQDNHSLSAETGVLRGLHFQHPPYAQSKLVRVVHGAVFDVIVDLRKKSPTFGAWQDFELTEQNCRILYMPRGFAHGFCTLAPDSEVVYKVDNVYMPDYDAGIRWDDPAIGVAWPTERPIISEKDAKLPRMAETRLQF
jgi:dTDP-4-dehydrorhamnose 3,5-epimerase